MTKEYRISQNEIERRIKAITLLTVSWPLGFVITGLLFWRENLGLLGIFLLGIILILIMFRIYTARFLNHFLKTRINSADEFLEKIGPNFQEKVLIKDINKIIIVKTATKNIREIRVYHEKKVIIFNGVDNFKEFVEELIKKCGKNVSLKIIKEPIDYDHPLYYLYFGLLVGFASVFFLKWISFLSSSGTGLNVLSYVISGYVSIMGLYFIIGKPLSKRYGKKSYRADFIWGLLLILGAVIIFISVK